MLKRKLNAQSECIKEKIKCLRSIDNNEIHEILGIESQFCDDFYKIELNLNQELMELSKPSGIQYIYNPVHYARRLHYNYLKKYLNGPKKVVFIGMNPGPNGMGQTGIPFGNINVVKNIMQLDGDVEQPIEIHPKRPVNGLLHDIEEPSGKRLWSLFEQLAGNLDIFFQQCFVHNFCPLIFYDNHGKNLTPNELKGSYKYQIRDLCLKTLALELSMLKSEIIIAVGDYVYQSIKKLDILEGKRLIKLAHPSLRAVGNQNWPEKAEKYLFDQNIIKFMRNEN